MPYKVWDQYSQTFLVGQSMFTPRDLTISELQVDDRPYGGWVYGGFRLSGLSVRGEAPWFFQEAADFESLEISVGVIGPWANAGAVQKQFHKWINSGIPQGWQNQLPNEVVVDAHYFRSYPLRLVSSQYDWASFDIEPFYNLRAGTVHLYGGAGIGAILGINHPLGAVPRKLPYAGRLGSREKENRRTEFALFGSFEGRGVAQNVFLDGNLTRDSHSVDREPFPMAPGVWSEGEFRRLGTGDELVSQLRRFVFPDHQV